MMRYKLYMGLALLSFVALNCTKEKAEQIVEVEEIEESACDSTISFAQEINTLIIAPNCNTSGCHADGAAGRFYNTHASIANDADIIYKVMSHDPSVSPMPKNSPKLSDSLIAQFKCWMDSGKLDN